MIETISEDTRKAMILHACNEFPREACGLLLKDGSYVPCRNVHDTPEMNFKMNPEDFMAHSVKDIAAVFHSHPGGLQCPSASDMQSQMSMNLPWIILPLKEDLLYPMFSFGGSVKPPLVGRPFRHGVTDCFSTLLDGTAELFGWRHKDFPRDWEWWHGNEDLYMNHFLEYGYERFDGNIVEPQPADILLCSVGARGKFNHGILYLGNSEGLHHVGSRKEYDSTRLSRRENILRYVSPGSVWLRKSPNAIRFAI